MSYRNLSVIGAVLAGFALGSVFTAQAEPPDSEACPACVCPACVCPVCADVCGQPEGLTPEARQAVEDALRAKAAAPQPVPAL